MQKISLLHAPHFFFSLEIGRRNGGPTLRSDHTQIFLFLVLLFFGLSIFFVQKDGFFLCGTPPRPHAPPLLSLPLSSLFLLNDGGEREREKKKRGDMRQAHNSNTHPFSVSTEEKEIAFCLRAD